MHPTFNITDLVPFTGTVADEDDNQDFEGKSSSRERNDVTPPIPSAPSSPSPLKGAITRSMMMKIQKGLPLDDHKFNGLLTIFTWAKEITKT